MRNHLEQSNGTAARPAQVPPAPASVTAVVLTYKRPRLATMAVRSLIEGEAFPPDRVVVVVNGEGGLEDEELEAQVHMVRLPRNLGPAGGFAAGMAAAFSDPSVRWAYLCEDDVGVFSLPRPRVGDVVDRAEARNRQPGRPVGAVVAYGGRFVGRGSHTVNLVPAEGSPDELVPVDVGTWGATLLAREVFDAGIRPDDVWFFGLEDFDFFCRVREGGFHVLLDAVSARAVAHQQTEAGWAGTLAPHRPTDESEPWRQYYQHRNTVLFTRRHGRRSWNVWDLAFAARHVQQATEREERRAILHGLWDGARGRFGEHPAYGRTMGEYAAVDETNKRPDVAFAGIAANGDEDGMMDRPQRSNGTGARPAQVPPAPAAVTAVVLTYKRPRLATMAVRSLIEGDGFPPDRVVVVVNGEGGLEDEELEARVHMVRLPRNLGPAGGFAAGMAAAFSDPSVRWAYLCEDDVSLFSLPSPRVGDVVDRAEARNRQPGRPVGAVVAYGRRFVGRGSETVNLVPAEGSPDELVPVDVAGWVATLLAREVFDAGLQPDEKFFFCMEDFDFFCRVREGGFDVLVDAVSARAVADQLTLAGWAEAMAPHRPTYESEPWRQYYHHRNTVLFTGRHGRRSWYLWDLAFAARHVQQATGREERRAILHGLWDGARGRFGEHPAYGRTTGEHAAADETNERPDPTCVG